MDATSTPTANGNPTVHPTQDEIHLRTLAIQQQWSPSERMQRAESGSAARVAFCQAICNSLPPGERRQATASAERRRNPRR
jgi:hypothetical protein